MARRERKGWQGEKGKDSKARKERRARKRQRGKNSEERKLMIARKDSEEIMARKGRTSL